MQNEYLERVGELSNVTVSIVNLKYKIGEWNGCIEMLKCLTEK